MVPPYISDKYGAITIIAPACAFAGLGCFLLPTVRSAPGLIAYDIFVGLASGTYVALRYIARAVGRV